MDDGWSSDLKSTIIYEGMGLQIVDVRMYYGAQ
jgi:hypothetical protein